MGLIWAGPRAPETGVVSDRSLGSGLVAARQRVAVMLGGTHVARYQGFATANGTLRQFATSATGSAIRFGGRSLPTRLLIDATGDAEDSWDPAWLMAEDCAQDPVGFGGIVYWEPDGDDVPGGQPLSLVIEAYDLARRAGLRVTVPMVTGRKNPLLRTPTGPESVVEIPVPEVAEPRYADWDLAKFTRWAEWELAHGVRRAKKLAKYRGDARIPEQRYPEIAEYAGFTYVDDWRMLRNSACRTGAYWFGKAMSIVWKPGEQGARDQLLASARSKSQDEEPRLALAAVWWSESGVTQARFADIDAGQAQAGTWSIEPGGGISGLFMRGIGLGENKVSRISPPSPLEYPSTN
jgi:hypothetical protein